MHEEDNLSYLEECRARLLAEGVNLNAFNTAENAADMYTVADALGHDRFNFYGVSYGTLLAQYVQNQTGEHPGQLRSVIIDGVVPIDFEVNAGAAQSSSHAFRNLFNNCAQDEVCNRDFPDVENVFLSLVDQLNQQPAAITLTAPGETAETIETTLDGEEFVMVVFEELYATSYDHVLPRRIYKAAQNNDFR